MVRQPLAAYDGPTMDNQPPAPPALAARCGIGLRAPHHADWLARAAEPDRLVEVHSENFFGGGRALQLLDQVRARQPVSLHAVGLSLGGSDALCARHLDALAALADRIAPALVSEHLSWSAHGGLHSHDLLPLPRTREVLNHLVPRVQQVQERLRRPIGLENVSAYLAWRDDEMSEAELLAELARRTGCWLLVDVNNLYVNQRNHGSDALAVLRALPAQAVGEYHLAGHVVNAVAAADGTPAELLIDSHDQPVCEDVWALYDAAITLIGPRPSIVEWDTGLPPLPTLLAEADRADGRLRRAVGAGRRSTPSRAQALLGEVVAHAG